MKRAGKYAMAFALITFSLSLAVPSGAVTKKWALNNLISRLRGHVAPVWSIFQDGTRTSVPWITYGSNPRFAVYDADTPADQSDDLVLDRETGLIWERAPSAVTGTWISTLDRCYQKTLGKRKGFRLPKVEELASLIEDGKVSPPLPNGYPFSNVQNNNYWSGTSYDAGRSWAVSFNTGTLAAPAVDNTFYGWCVRGGTGYDGR